MICELKPANLEGIVTEVNRKPFDDIEWFKLRDDKGNTHSLVNLSPEEKLSGLDIVDKKIVIIEGKVAELK